MSYLLNLLLIVDVASAQELSLITGDIPGCDFASGELAAKCVPIFLAHVIKLLFGLTGAVFLVMILIGGYQMALAKAMNKSRSEAWRAIGHATLGFILVGFSWYILDFIISALAGV